MVAEFRRERMHRWLLRPDGFVHEQPGQVCVCELCVLMLILCSFAATSAVLAPAATRPSAFRLATVRAKNARTSTVCSVFGCVSDQDVCRMQHQERRLYEFHLREHTRQFLLWKLLLGLPANFTPRHLRRHQRFEPLFWLLKMTSFLAQSV